MPLRDAYGDASLLSNRDVFAVIDVAASPGVPGGPLALHLERGLLRTATSVARPDLVRHGARPGACELGYAIEQTRFEVRLSTDGEARRARGRRPGGWTRTRSWRRRGRASTRNCGGR